MIVPFILRRVTWQVWPVLNHIMRSTHREQGRQIQLLLAIWSIRRWFQQRRNVLLVTIHSYMKAKRSFLLGMTDYLLLERAGGLKASSWMASRSAKGWQTRVDPSLHLSNQRYGTKFCIFHQRSSRKEFFNLASKLCTCYWIASKSRVLPIFQLQRQSDSKIADQILR